jgi:hypothetical protein
VFCVIIIFFNLPLPTSFALLSMLSIVIKRFTFLFSSMAKSSSTIQIYQKVQISPTNGDSKRNSKNSSTTPTPTNTNPDIVRIYVPPADDMLPDKIKYEQRDRGEDEISQCSNRSSIIHVEYETLPHERPLQGSPPSKIDQTSNNNTNVNVIKAQHQPQQYYYPNPNQQQQQQSQQHQSSSSRRGSMNRKTPSPLLGDVIVECDHIKSRRSQDIIYDDNNIKMLNNNVNSGSLKRLTSFEELAKKSDSNSLLFIHESTDNNFRYNSNSYSNSKPRSDYEICYSYKNLETELDLNSKNQQMMMKKSTSHSYNIRRSSERKHSSSDNSPFDYDLLKEKRKDHRHHHNYEDSDGRHMEMTNDNSIKSYDRFFNSDDEMDDDDDDEVRNSRSTKRTTTHKYRSHIISGTEADDDDEDNSSNSPTNKSIPRTPLNDTLPLLSSDVEPMSGYQIPPPVLPSPTTSSKNSSLRNKSRIPRPNRNQSSSMLTKNSSVSSPDGSDRSEGFRLNQSSVSYQSPTSHHRGNSENNGNSSQRNDNKIRIKINQKN